MNSVNFIKWYLVIHRLLLIIKGYDGIKILTYLGISIVSNLHTHTLCRAQWLRGRVSDCRLREPGFESCAGVLKPWASFFTLHCSSSLSCTNEYLAIDSGGYVYEQLSRINYSIWMDVSQRSRDGV